MPSGSGWASATHRYGAATTSAMPYARLASTRQRTSRVALAAARERDAQAERDGATQRRPEERLQERREHAGDTEREEHNEAAVRERAAQVAGDDEAGQREREHEGEIEVVERLGSLVGAEAEDEAACQRGRRARLQHAAEEVRAPGGQRRRGQREHVVGRHGPEGRRQRPGQQRRARDGARPGQVPAAGRVDEVRQERMEAVPDRMRPPRKRPREGRLVRPVGADDRASAVPQHAATEEREREQRIARERCERAATPSKTRRCASRDQRPPSPASTPPRRHRPWKRAGRRPRATPPCSLPSGRSCAGRRPA